MTSPFETLEAVVSDDRFPEVDLALRRGRHVGRGDGSLYDFIHDALDHLEPFYRRFGGELVHRSDGYFYLLPTGDRLGRRHSSAGEMLVGQALALLYLDPTTLQRGGLVSRELLLQRLDGLVGVENLVKTLDPRRRRHDARVAVEVIWIRVVFALRRLDDLGFLDIAGEVDLRLRPALLRFAEPVRGLEDPAKELERLVGRGEVALTLAPEVDADPGTDDFADDEDGP